MKIITWKELLELQGDIVWSYYSEDEFPTVVMTRINLYSDCVKRCFP